MILQTTDAKFGVVQRPQAVTKTHLQVGQLDRRQDLQEILVIDIETIIKRLLDPVIDKPISDVTEAALSLKMNPFLSQSLAP